MSLPFLWLLARTLVWRLRFTGPAGSWDNWGATRGGGEGGGGVGAALLICVNLFLKLLYNQIDCGLNVLLHSVKFTVVDYIGSFSLHFPSYEGCFYIHTQLTFSNYIEVLELHADGYQLQCGYARKLLVMSWRAHPSHYTILDVQPRDLNLCTFSL